MCYAKLTLPWKPPLYIGTKCVCEVMRLFSRDMTYLGKVRVRPQRLRPLLRRARHTHTHRNQTSESVSPKALAGFTSPRLQAFEMAALHQPEIPTPLINADDVFANEDLSELIARASIDERDLTTWSCTRPAYGRAALRLVHKANRQRIDSLCEAYEDLRRSGFARASDSLTTELAPQAAVRLLVSPVPTGARGPRLPCFDSRFGRWSLSEGAGGAADLRRPAGPAPRGPRR